MLQPGYKAPLIIMCFIPGKVTENIEEFCNSWRENAPLEAASLPSPNEPVCDGQSQEAKQTGHSMCSLILQPPFQSCHESFSPFPFMAACANDMCLSGSDTATWCWALTEYARACAQVGHSMAGGPYTSSVHMHRREVDLHKHYLPCLLCI
ncbi:otogelin-like [Xenopus laevis]|uniref:Otogelin-like n=1 Tax=Xenopus laevis TaxID=8355 RepID=A0A8J1KI10_XENLA|nr:otogelin-like [Xenopus laevis]